ncbi:MAG: hypothetical protein HY290_18565 [Planctomycetia bacterium]|nr:hypothetical protein [Planctomycetia bacterium]
MNLGQLIEFAAIISVHSPNLIESTDSVPEAALERYLYWSELRAADWITALDALPTEIADAPGPQRPSIWNQAEPTVVDVFAGGLTSRVWGAVLTACDRTRKSFTYERTARRVL